MKMPEACLAALAVFAAARSADAAEFRATAITPEYILVQADASADENAAFFADPRAGEAEKLGVGWQKARKRQEIQADVEKTVRAPFAGKMKSLPGAIAYWPQANGCKHMVSPSGERFQLKAAEILHCTFVKVPRMDKGAEIDLGIAGMFVYDPARPSPAFKVNQAGYAPQARKYAYVGAWLAGAGALGLESFAGKEFNVVDAKSGRVAMTGRLAARMKDPVTEEGAPFTGEETLEADLTKLDGEGRYFISVEGIGRSMDFEVSSNAIARAWGVHMQGLFNKRCGIEKKPPYTQWTCPACHLDVVRGVQPPDEGRYASCVKPADGKDVLDKKGKPVVFKHFNVITCSEPLCATNEHLSIPGGYHDAADYDRRPMHLQIPRSLALDYLFKPGNFTDGQLTIHEAGNGIPDILDEAYWGVRHLLAAQQEDGGIGDWIETTGHPGGENEGPWRDPHRYYLAIPTHDSCYNYAGTAALVARAFRAAGKDELAGKLLESAKRAWEWADGRESVVANMRGSAGDWKKGPFVDLVYREGRDWSVRHMLTAALNLSALTGDMRYFDKVVARKDDLKAEINKSSWGWSAYTFAEFGLPGQKIPAEFEDVKADWIRRIVKTADGYLDNLENAYPYRTPWFAPSHPFVHTMSWGNCHPLRRAETFIAAHIYTGDAKYLEGVFLANDFHCGCNPRGESMTSGLGTYYPARFLDLQSLDDGIAEYVGGITPYQWTYGVAWDAKKMIYSGDLLAKWPIWRRFANIEPYSVAASEYTVWETISPCAAVLGYLLDAPRKVPPEVYSRKPCGKISDVPGYWIRP